jgi:hypothetical protein
MQAMTKYLVSLPDYQERMRKSATMTAADRIAQLESNPRTASILKENSLTAIVASPANVAFAKANLAQLKPKMDAADGIRR